MRQIRPLVRDDLPAVAQLRRRTFQRGRRTAPGALEAYLEQVFIDNPWADPELPSWVAEEDGRVVGFLGVIPRPLLLHDRRIRAAVTSQFMVAPESRGLLTIALLQRVFAGPQDALYADAVNGSARSLWTRLGGSLAPFYGFRWTRALRPARWATTRWGGSQVARGARLAARPFLDTADLVVAVRRAGAALPGQAAPLALRELDAGVLRRLLPASTLQPLYDPASLDWLLARAAERWPEDPVECATVRLAGEVIGVFAYLRGTRGTAQVLLLAAAAGHAETVLRHLFRCAREGGAIAARGRVDPRLVHACAAAGCRFESDGFGILVHARDPSLELAMVRGDAALSGLDGEWWLDF